MSRHKSMMNEQRIAAERIESSTSQEFHCGALPSLLNAHKSRTSLAVKEVQLPLWRTATRTFQRGYEQLVYVGWMFGEAGNWATTADAYAAGRFINPRNAALLYVGFTGQPDYLKPAVPEMLAVLAPLKHEEGRLLVDQDEVLVRSLTSAGR